jgi:hypothetical protein
MAGKEDIELNIKVNAAEAAAGFKYAQTLAHEFSSEVVSKFAGIVGAAAVAKGAFEAVNEAMAANASMAKQIGKLTAKFHIDPKQVHSLLIASNEAGVSVRQLMMSMKSLGALASKAMVDKDTATVFKNMGTDLNNLNDIAAKPAANMADISQQLMQIGNEQDRAAYGAKLFGRQYQQLLPLIEKLGTDSEARRRFLDNENAMTNEQIEQLRAAAKLQTEMKESWEAIVATFAPLILSITGFVSMIFKAFQGTKDLRDMWSGVNAEFKAYDTAKKQEAIVSIDAELTKYKAALKEVNVARKFGEDISGEARRTIINFEAGKVAKGTGTFEGGETGVGDYSVDQTFMPAGSPYAGRKRPGGGTPVFTGIYAGDTKFGVDPKVAESGAAAMVSQIEAEIKKAEDEAHKIEVEYGNNNDGLVSRIRRHNKGELEKDPENGRSYFLFHPQMLRQGYSTGAYSSAHSQYAAFPWNAAKMEKEGDAARRYYDLTRGTSGLRDIDRKDKEGKPMLVDAIVGGGPKGLIEHLKEQLAELKQKGNLLGMAQRTAISAHEEEELIGSAVDPILNAYLKASGQSDEKYVKGGKIYEGKRPTGLYNKVVEDVDAAKQKQKKAREARALRKKQNAALIERGEVSGLVEDYKLAAEESNALREEETNPKVQAAAALKKALDEARDKASKVKMWREKRMNADGTLETDEDLQHLTDDEDYAGTYQTNREGKMWKTKEGSLKEKFLNWKVATDTVRELERAFAAAESAATAAALKQIDAENNIVSKRMKMAKEMSGLDETMMAKTDEQTRRLHERKMNYMKMEGKTQKQMAEENLVFEVQQLEKYFDEYNAAKAEFTTEGSAGGTVITKEEQDILDRKYDKVLNQAGKAEGALNKMVTPGWTEMSSMRAIGGGGMIVGTSGSTAIEQLNEAKTQTPILRSMDSTLRGLIGGNVANRTETSKPGAPATYAASKGTVPQRPMAPADYYIGSDGKPHKGETPAPRPSIAPSDDEETE